MWERIEAVVKFIYLSNVAREIMTIAVLLYYYVMRHGNEKKKEFQTNNKTQRILYDHQYTHTKCMIYYSGTTRAPSV